MQKEILEQGLIITLSRVLYIEMATIIQLKGTAHPAAPNALRTSRIIVRLRLREEKTKQEGRFIETGVI